MNCILSDIAAPSPAARRTTRTGCTSPRLRSLLDLARLAASRSHFHARSVTFQRSAATSRNTEIKDLTLKSRQCELSVKVLRSRENCRTVRLRFRLAIASLRLLSLATCGIRRRSRRGCHDVTTRRHDSGSLPLGWVPRVPRTHIRISQLSSSKTCLTPSPLRSEAQEPSAGRSTLRSGTERGVKPSSGAVERVPRRLYLIHEIRIRYYEELLYSNIHTHNDGPTNARKCSSRRTRARSARSWRTRPTRART